MLTTVLQATSLAALSNVLAQLIDSIRSDTSLSLDMGAVAQFATWAVISTPPNIYWQGYLEEQFPSSEVDSRGKKRLSKVNTIKKFLLDQTVGGCVNNAAFIAGMGALKGKNFDQILINLVQDFWPLMTSGLKLWPLVSILNFTIVPAQNRILFGSFVGLFWGIYLSLLTT